MDKADRPNRVMAAWRFDPGCLKQLKSFAKRKNTTQTGLIEGWIKRYCKPPKRRK